VRLQVATQVLGGAPGGKKSCRYVGLIMMPCGFGTPKPTAFSKSALSAVISIMSINIYQQLLSVIIEL
jgi:hypothetical protein